MNVVFIVNGLSFIGEFNNSPAAKKIAECLPVESIVSTWGDEIYFDTGISAPRDGETMDLNIGDIAYWPGGKCLCVFFGPTPASKGNKPVPASNVVVIGRISSSLEELRSVKDDQKIVVKEG